MNFTDAVDLTKKGEQVRRPSWEADMYMWWNGSVLVHTHAYFAFQTKTEKALEDVATIASEEGFMSDLSKNYNTLISNLNSVKDKAINDNEEQLKALLENEIITRYFYREGMYQYFLINNEEVKKATEIFGGQFGDTVDIAWRQRLQILGDPFGAPCATGKPRSNGF